MPGHVRADARKRGMHDHDGAPCWSRECAPTEAPTPSDAVREVVARERAAALREAADSFAEHRDWAYPYLVECQRWLRARADREEGER